MPPVKDGSGAASRTKETLKDALDAQLNLLHAFLPLHGWLVGQRREGAFGVLAAQGAWTRRGTLDPVGEFMQGQWLALTEHPGFHYRRLGDTEQALAARMLAGVSSCDSVVRRPLRDADGYVQAWLLGITTWQAISRTAEPGFPVDAIRNVLTAMTLALSLYTEFRNTSQQLAELQHNAFIEPLTGVLNRAGWTNRVEHLEAMVNRSEEDVAIIMLDLDLLKLVNDMRGHSAGDELLQLTAKTIGAALRSGDVVGRLGGDEFGVAIKGVNQPLAQALVQRLRTALDSVGVNVSIGLALKSEAGSLDGALCMADRRMYQDKRSKRLGDRRSTWVPLPSSLDISAVQGV